MSSAAFSDPGAALVALYDEALPEVYGYLLHRCGNRAVAEDLTSEVFLAAARAVGNGSAAHVSIPWLVAVARNKLFDHWRRLGREQRSLRTIGDPERPSSPEGDEGQALATLDALSADHRAALVLRHVDGLSVSEVAVELGRTLHATEALLTRARRSFRRLYEEVEER